MGITNRGVIYYLIPEKYGYGKIFNKTFRNLNKWEYISQEDNKALANSNFLRILNHAY